MNQKRTRVPKLNNHAIANICEMWVAGMAMDHIAMKHNINMGTVSNYISKYYLPATIDKKFTITIQSKLNDQCTEDNY